MKWACSIVQIVIPCSLSMEPGFNRRLVSVGFMVDNVELGDVTLRMFRPSTVSTIALLSISKVTNIMARLNIIKLFIYYIHDLFFW
jgi:hypothetical protein